MAGIPLTPTPIQINPTAGGGPITGAGGAAPTGGSVPSGAGQVNPAVTQLITKAREQGVPDAEIYNYLHQNGMIPTNALASSTGDFNNVGKPDTAQLQDTGSFLGNLGHSAGSFVKGLGNVIAHPIDTVKNVASVAEGLVETPIDLLTGHKMDNPVYEHFINNMAERYGGWDNLKTTMYQDPVGFLADVAAVADAGAGVVGKAGELSKIDSIVKAGNALDKVGEVANPINLAGKGVGLVGDLTKAGLGKIAPMLEKSALRLTPVQKANFAEFIQPVTKYISDQIPAGSPASRYESAVANINKIEDVIQDYLKNDASGITISRQTIIDAAEGLKKNFARDRDALEIDKQVDSFKSLLESKYPDSIPVADLNDLKRSTMSNAFNNAGTKVADYVEYKLGDIMYDHIKGATANVPVLGKYGLGDINKAYQVAIKAEQLLKTAMGRPQVGFLDKLAIDAIGGMSSGPGGLIAGHVLSNTLPITAAKAAAGKVTNKISKIPKVKLPGGVKSAANALVRINANSKDYQNQ